MWRLMRGRIRWICGVRRNRRFELALATLLVCLVAGRKSMAQTVPGAVRAVGLKVDAAAEPLGIDDPAPRFTWRLEASRSGVQQTSYHVAVSTSGPGQRQSVVWDSK